MADLTELQSALAVKLVGSDSTGLETVAVNADANGQLLVTDVLNNSGTQGAIVVGTSAVAARVGGANLANRKSLTIFHNGNSTLFWGYTNAVTTASGSQIFKNTMISIPAGDGTTIYLIAGAISQDVRITEAS